MQFLKPCGRHLIRHAKMVLHFVFYSFLCFYFMYLKAALTVLSDSAQIFTDAIWRAHMQIVRPFIEDELISGVQILRNVHPILPLVDIVASVADSLVFVLTEGICQLDVVIRPSHPAAAACKVCVHLALRQAAIALARAVDALEAATVIVAATGLPERNSHVEDGFGAWLVLEECCHLYCLIFSRSVIRFYLSD